MTYAEIAWPPEALEDALASLARATGLDSRPVTLPRRPPDTVETDVRARDAWLEATAELLGFEVEPIECSYGALEGVLQRMAPGLVRLTLPEGPRYLAILRSKRGVLEVLTPRLARERLPAEAVHDVLAAAMDRDLPQRIDRWLAMAAVGPKRLARARRELLQHCLSDCHLGEMWLLRADPGASFLGGLVRAGALGRVARFGAVAVLQVLATVGSWALVGRAAIGGDTHPTWLAPWALIALCGVLLQLCGTHLAGRLTVDVAAAVKQRLLCGALRMDPDAIRVQGSGRLLGVVAESTAVETAGLSGAIASLAALAQMIGAGAVLAMGAGGPWHVLALVAWCAIVLALVVRLRRRRGAWTAERLELTGSFVENVVANRTRVVQEAPARWHLREDAALASYAEASDQLDASGRLLSVLPARGWLLVGFGALVPALLAGPIDPGALAISIGGILQAQIAFASLVAGATALVGAHVAWGTIGSVFRAAAARPTGGAPWVEARRDAERGEVVLDVRGASFRYPDGEPVLRACSLTVRAGEQVLLEGASGSGKSTLAAVVTGTRTVTSGQVLVRGLDRTTVGSARWQRQVATAPQFHDNHVLSGSLAFNLLMGRAWPPAPGDRREAEAVCRELGLGSMIDRMPSGLDQVVGETGWQLSHGERSRVFLARALLQRAELVVLDETFGALDPLTLQSCLEVVRRRAPALVVIAHP